MNKTIDLHDYFKNPATQRQKQYEAVRAVIVENESAESVAKKFNYKQSTIYSLVRDAKAGKLELFPTVQKGPKQKRTSTIIQNKIIDSEIIKNPIFSQDKLCTPSSSYFVSVFTVHARYEKTA